MMQDPFPHFNSWSNVYNVQQPPKQFQYLEISWNPPNPSLIQYPMPWPQYHVSSWRQPQRELALPNRFLCSY